MKRRGTTILELAVAGALIGALLVVCLQLLAATAAGRRAADQQQCAILELDNVMERVVARPWAELTTAALAAEQLSPWAERQLPGAELKLKVSNVADEPDAKRITAALSWRDRSGQMREPMTLSTWRYDIGDQQVKDED